MIDPKPTTTNPKQPTMNEETDTPETLADIIAEMRRFAAFAADRSRITPAPSLAAEQECHAAKLTKYADRIEAAAKREYAETKAYFEKLHDGPSMICTAKNCAVRNIGLSIAAAPRKFDESAPGNAAAQREALEWAAQFVELGVDDDLGADGQNLTTAAEMARAALAAPARNCDRFKTADEAVAAFADHLRAWENAHGIYSEYPDHPVQVPAGAFAWLFSPAEGGDRA